MNFDIVLVNFNSGPLVQKAVQSLRKFENHSVFNIYLVDNGSSDLSFFCHPEFFDVELVRLSCNHGFARACNIGAKCGNSDYIIFMNPDTAIVEPVLEGLSQEIASHEPQGFGIYGVQLKDAASQVSFSCYRFPSISSVLCKVVGLQHIFPKFGLAGSMTDFDHQSNMEVDIVMGAFFVVQRELFEKLNGFDEDFFVYYEEVDFCYRALNSGKRTLFLSDYFVFHEGGGVSKNYLAERLFYSLRSRSIYFGKHFSQMQKMSIYFMTVILEYPIRMLLSGLSPRALNIVLSSFKMYVKWLFTGGR